MLWGNHRKSRIFLEATTAFSWCFKVVNGAEKDAEASTPKAGCMRFLLKDVLDDPPFVRKVLIFKMDCDDCDLCLT